VHAGPIAVVVVWLSVLALASSASAAFPGRNGLLAVTPVSRPGLALMNPQTGAAKLVCRNTLLCGAPSHPQWSPNGRALIVVDTNTSRPEVLASDGTCLWCLLGRQLSNQHVNTPAFASSGSAITFGIGGSRAKAGLWQLSLSGSRARRISKGRVSDAVWSERG
jgi:Tol biopolymer transport system component